MNRQTDTSENITFPQLRRRAVKITTELVILEVSDVVALIYTNKFYFCFIITRKLGELIKIALVLINYQHLELRSC